MIARPRRTTLRISLTSSSAYIGLDNKVAAAEKQAAVHAARVAAACAYLQTVEDELFGRAMPQQLD